MNIERNKKSILILMADDDEDDRMMAKEALDEARLVNEMDFVEDGEQLMDYLHRKGQYAGLANKPLPGIILLDLNMPRKDGRKALKEIKEDPHLWRIPVVVLTTSKAEEDMCQAYGMMANSFIIKPDAFGDLVKIMKILVKYWFDVARLPVDETVYS